MNDTAYTYFLQRPYGLGSEGVFEDYIIPLAAKTRKMTKRPKEDIKNEIRSIHEAILERMKLTTYYEGESERLVVPASDSKEADYKREKFQEAWQNEILDKYPSLKGAASFFPRFGPVITESLQKLKNEGKIDNLESLL